MAFLDWEWVLVKHVLYINHLYQFWYFYHKVNHRYTDCHILPFFSQWRPKVVIWNYYINSQLTISCTNFGTFVMIHQLSYFTIFFTMQTGSSYLQIIPLILNPFWPNLVHPYYRIHFWTSFVLCVVFYGNIFGVIREKSIFWPFIYIFQRAITHSEIVRFTIFFCTCSRQSN